MAVGGGRGQQSTRHSFRRWSRSRGQPRPNLRTAGCTASPHRQRSGVAAARVAQAARGRRPAANHCVSRTAQRRRQRPKRPQRAPRTRNAHRAHQTSAPRKSAPALLLSQHTPRPRCRATTTRPAPQTGKGGNTISGTLTFSTIEASVECSLRMLRSCFSPSVSSSSSESDILARCRREHHQSGGTAIPQASSTRRSFPPSPWRGAAERCQRRREERHALSDWCQHLRWL